MQATPHMAKNARREIPRGQIAAVLIGFPLLYMLNSFTPWSRQLFVDHNRQAWPAFWASAFVLWWTSVAAVAFVMRRHGWRLRDVGIDLGRPQRLAAVIAAVGVGFGAVAVRETFGRLNALGIARLVDLWSSASKPHTANERVLWVVFGVVSAAFCEEFVYRGFGLHALRSRGMRMAWAAVLASLAWIGVHGVGAIFGFPFYVVWAVVLTGLVVRTKSLVPALVVHSAIHVFVILGS